MVKRKVPVAAIVALSALVVLGALAGRWGLAAALFVVVMVLATGWPTLLGLPTQRGSTSVLAGCGAVAVLIALFTQTEDPLRFVALWLALAVIITFAHQLLRRDYRPRLVESVTGVVAGVVTANLVVGWLAADSLAQVLLAAACLVSTAVAMAVPLPWRIAAPLALLAGVAAAAVVAALGPLGTLPAVVIGGAVSAVAVGLERIFSHLPSMASRQAGLAAGAATVAASGMVIYLAAEGLRLVFGF